MDFIENWFGFAPDGGSGVLEGLYVVAIISTIAGLTHLRALRKRRPKRRVPSP